MATNRVGETGLEYSVFPAFNPPNTSFINQEGSSFDFGELEEDTVLQGYKIPSDETKSSLYTSVPRTASTLDMFPSWPMRVHLTPRGSNSSTDSRSAVNVAMESKPESRSHIELEPGSPISSNNRKSTSEQQEEHILQQLQHLQIPQQFEMESEGGSPVTTGGSSHSQQAHKPFSEKTKGIGSTSEKTRDAKTLRRLAQNREAAKKSRLRKKAYVQQLESSRIRLAQLEQDLHCARSQGLFLGGGGGNLSSGAAMFDMEYARWLDEDHRHMVELRKGLQSQFSDGDLRVIVDSFVAHYDDIFRFRGVAAKSDVFHLITGMWTTPAERCFLWMGGFRPSELIKMLSIQLDPLTEQQVVGIYSLQQSSQQAEEALTQGLDHLHQSLVDTIASGSVNDGVHHMVVALGKLTTLEGFVREADNLRQQAIHQLHRILTVRQAAKCFLVISEYYGRLRALSSLWASQPRKALISDENSCETPTTDLQMMQSSQSQFSNFGWMMK